MREVEFPRVTVGTLCYNTGRHVIESLQSIKDQAYPNIQHIIVDDCSTDQSQQLLEDWILKNNYHCILIKHEINKGINYGLKEILAISDGDYFGVTSDDLWVPCKLHEQIALFKQHPEAGMVYGDTMLVDESGEVVYPSLFEASFGPNYQPPSGDIFKHVVNNFFFYLQAALIDLRLFKSLNFYMDEKIISEDWDWQLSIARNSSVYGVNKVYAIYRRTNASVTAQNWNPERMHMVLKSHFYTIARYYRHPKNTVGDDRAVAEKLRNVFSQLKTSVMCTYKERIEYSFKIFKLTGLYSDFMVLAGLCFGFDFLWKTVKLASARSSGGK